MNEISLWLRRTKRKEERIYINSCAVSGDGCGHAPDYQSYT